MGDHDDRLAELVDAAPQEAEDLRTRAGVEVARRLVGEDHLGIVGQGAGDGHTLHLTAGKLRRTVVQTPAEPDLFGQLFGPLGAAGRVPPQVIQRQFNVPLDGQLRNQVKALKDEAQIPQAQLTERVVVQLADVFAVEVIGARRQAVQTTQDVHHGALARTAGPHDRPEIAPGKRHVDAVQSPHLFGAHHIDLAGIFQAYDLMSVVRRNPIGHHRPPCG